MGEPAAWTLGAVTLPVEVLTGKRLWSGVKEKTWDWWRSLLPPTPSGRKDMVHVRALFAFGAEALHVELTQFLDEVVVALNVLQLAVVTLQPPTDPLRTFCLMEKDTADPATGRAYLDAPSPQEVAAEQAPVHQQHVLLLELLSHEPAAFDRDVLQSRDESVLRVGFTTQALTP